MWKILPKLGLLKLLFTVFSALLLAALALFLAPASGGTSFVWSNFIDALGFAVPVMFVFLAIIFILGKWGWRLLWKSPVIGKFLGNKVCPDLNGKWDGLIEYKKDDGSDGIKEVTLTIEADLFNFEIRLDSDDGYQSSRVVQWDLYRNSQTKKLYLSYIFESEVPKPDEGDEQFFQGAAQLEVSTKNNGISQLGGVYWTNRMWRQGKQTAGNLTATRSA